MSQYIEANLIRNLHLNTTRCKHMTGKKSTKQALSPEAKAALKADMRELPKGAMDMDKIDIVPSGVHTQTDYEEIADVIRGGKAWIMEYRASRNTIYNVRKALCNPKAAWNTQPDPKDKSKTVPRADAIKNVQFGDVLVKEDKDGQPAKVPTKNTALYLA